MQGLYVLDTMERGGYLDFGSRLAGTIIQRMVCVHSESFSAYCFKIRQSNEFIVAQVARFSCLCDLLTELILNILMGGKKR